MVRNTTLDNASGCAAIREHGGRVSRGVKGACTTNMSGDSAMDAMQLLTKGRTLCRSPDLKCVEPEVPPCMITVVCCFACVLLGGMLSLTLSSGCRCPPVVGRPSALKLYSLNSSVRHDPLQRGGGENHSSVDTAQACTPHHVCCRLPQLNLLFPGSAMHLGTLQFPHPRVTCCCG